MFTVVLGAGIAGLSYAFNHKSQENIIVFEKADYYGGLCHSFCIDGFTFDSAVHLSFTNIQKVRDVFDKVPYITHNPMAYNYYKGTWLKHPVINNLSPLTALEKTKCIHDFYNRKKQQDIKNYKDWLRATYGNYIAENFYEQYTRKYWTMEADQLSTTWLGKRFNLPDGEKILLGSYETSERNDYYANEMRYPQNGGYQTFLTPLLKDLNIVYKTKAEEIDLENQEILLSDGNKIKYDKLVSSIPLPELVNITKQVPEEVMIATRQLKSSKISIVSVAFGKENVPKHLWTYIYDKEIMAARMNAPSIKSKNNVPKGFSSLQFEIYHYPGEIINKDSIVENVLQSIKTMEIAEMEDILFWDYRLLEYGNVIFELGMELERKKILQYYEGNGKVKLIGRFGKWDYLWSDQSYMSGWEM